MTTGTSVRTLPKFGVTTASATVVIDALGAVPKRSSAEKEEQMKEKIEMTWCIGGYKDGPWPMIFYAVKCPNHPVWYDCEWFNITTA